ncbi:MULTISPECIES: hypothetical protein [Kaistia]|uniref:Uncharacterized protein n=1 Tax=Kaistia nematophila TaxID=2994654 RepID=A0A9X3IKY9_9HYPH|nr:hypothetical protein [Kaistia nematophila]MCX5569973.1 hypothetical protein [Kaistia nematophila]
MLREIAGRHVQSTVQAMLRWHLDEGAARRRRMVPSVVRSFLSKHDLFEKALVPLVTHGGYGPGDSHVVRARRAPASPPPSSSDAIRSARRSKR